MIEIPGVGNKIPENQNGNFSRNRRTDREKPDESAVLPLRAFLQIKEEGEMSVRT